MIQFSETKKFPPRLDKPPVPGYISLMKSECHHRKATAEEQQTVMEQRALKFLGNLEALKRKLARSDTAAGALWQTVHTLARGNPDAFPWLCPFAAVVSGEPELVEAARRQIRRYVGTLEQEQLGMGVQFHFWCFAFPHARWSLYFKLIDEVFGWEPRERESLLGQLMEFQFINFFYGMRTKPEPECRDNQTLSLCFSNALFGYLFGDEPELGSLARRLGEDGFRRLPGLLAEHAASGYSGEGSTYMDYVVGIGTSLSLELLRLATGHDYFPEAEPVLRMIRREWLPSGLLHPYDHYGYTWPSRATIAYLTARTGSGYGHELLNLAAAANTDLKIAWGFDDWVWTLIWQPEAAPGTGFENWCEPELGGALFSADRQLALMQWWDPGSALPIREHVNPNSLILEAWGSPLLIDGVATRECERFHFEDAFIDRSGLDFGITRSWFGEGCAGAHNVILIDDREGLRPRSGRLGGKLLAFDPERKLLAGEVTELYAQHWPGIRSVRRSSRLRDERFWLISDDLELEQEHTVTARWFLRPERIPAKRGVAIRTAEGVRLHLIPVVGPAELKVERVDGYPNRLEGYSLLADFRGRGKSIHWRWLAFPVNERRVVADESADWQVATSADALSASGLVLPFTRPAFMLAPVPVGPVWFYRKKLQIPADGRYFLRLPRGLVQPAAWLNDRELDLQAHFGAARLLALDLELPPGEVEVTVRTEVPMTAEGDLGIRFGGPVRLLREEVSPEPEVELGAEGLNIQCGAEHWFVPAEELA